MQRIPSLRPTVLALALLYTMVAAAQQNAPGIKGNVTDPSGASVPGAVVEITGEGEPHRATTNSSGHYSIAPLKSGNYALRVTSSGFSAYEVSGLAISASTNFDVHLSIESTTQVLNVEEQSNAVSTDPASNGTALVLGQKELATLSDDPDELAQQLQALAGPGGGPDGGQIYIDGFTGGNLPPKASIREVRINSNPYSTEYDKPGFGRIEILTKPGTDYIRGQAFFQFNDQYLNSRSPLLTDSTRAPYGNLIGALNLSGPIIRNKASFGFDFERRNINENAFVLATTLDSSLNPQTINQAVVTPQTRMTISPRLDYSINANNTLVVRYQHTGIELDQSGVGSYNLPSTAYNNRNAENTLQVTESAILNPTLINETRFQFLRTSIADLPTSTDPTISVLDAFTSGGASVGNSGNTTTELELTNTTTWTHQTHTFNFGARARQYLDRDTSLNNFNGMYTFFGGVGPELDSSNQPIAGTSIDLTALEVYQRTLLGISEGLSNTEIRSILGGGASQFSLSGGAPTQPVNVFDIGAFINDDWRIRPNLTLSYGLRYETQNKIHDYSDIAPRFSLAWGIGGNNGASKTTVLRAGFGVFYDRIADTVILNSERYNGSSQQSYLIQNPDFYPSIPSTSTLADYSTSQQLQPIYKGIKAPRVYQASIGLDRQINHSVRISAQYLESRGVHLANIRNINAPTDGVYPFGDSDIRLLTESSGLSRTHQLFISPNIKFKNMFVFGFYSLSYGKDNNEGEPADPNNLSAEWGPSTYADIRHRFVMGTSIPLRYGLSISPFVVAQSGTPYNITTGQDTNGDSFASERPSLMTGLTAAQCTGSTLAYEAGFGCFNLTPAAGTSIGRNFARGPAQFTVNLRVSRTWSFGNRGESGSADQGGPPPGSGGIRGGGGPPPGGGGPGGGPPPGMFGAASGKRYNVTLTASARNLLNHPNYTPPSGDLSSPYFGEYRSLAGFGPMGASTTYDRKIDLQVRFQF